LLLAVIVLAREVEAKNFVLNMRHLGRREPVVQPATAREAYDLLGGGRFSVVKAPREEKILWADG
jgi:hypothetical protein